MTDAARVWGEQPTLSRLISDSIVKGKQALIIREFTLSAESEVSGIWWHWEKFAKVDINTGKYKRHLS